MPDRENGTVKGLNDAWRFGFINCENDEDAFVQVRVTFTAKA